MFEFTLRSSVILAFDFRPQFETSFETLTETFVRFPSFFLKKYNLRRLRQKVTICSHIYV